jgi:protein-S-isoprenylcysteine O-methyltransferase Ste14
LAAATIESMADMRGPGRRSGVIAYAIVAYAAFVTVVLWAIAFLADLDVVPAVDGRRAGSVWAAVLIDAALLLLFAVQHSVMARARFKRWLATVLPEAAERSTYVLATSVLLALLFGQWRPIPATVWRVDEPPATAVIWTVYAIGCVVAVGATFMVDHLDFSGLRQAWWPSRRGPYEPPSFTDRWLYAWVRHPMMLGLLIVFWATPRMSLGHVLFAAAGSAYIAVGVRFEERDLRRQLGDDYIDYARRVPAVVPTPYRSARPIAASAVIRDRDRYGLSTARRP